MHKYSPDGELIMSWGEWGTGPGHVGGQVERIAVAGTRPAGRADGQHQLAVAVELVHAVGVALGAEHVVLVVDEDPVGVFQHPGAPFLQEPPVAVEHH